jgi:hypothetical protein
MSGLPWPCGVEVAVLGLSGRWQAQSAIKRRQSQVLEILAASSGILPARWLTAFVVPCQDLAPEFVWRLIEKR